jgi:rare lipoprotein A
MAMTRPARPAAVPASRWSLAASGSLLALLAACGTAPKGPGGVDRDGPPAQVPNDVLATPDAQPRVEPIRVGGANKPYEVMGVRYTPVVEDKPIVQTGLASWYGRKFHGRATASGEIYSMYGMTAAHATFPIPSYARVRNPKNGKEVIVRINDRGPFHSNRILDLSYAAAAKLDVLHGVARVEVERITFESIRTGAWRRDGDTAPIVQVSEATAPPDTAPAAADAAPVQVQQTTARIEGAKGWWVQLGAFNDRDGALALQRAVNATNDWMTPLLALFQERGLHKLQAGPYDSRSDAMAALQRIRAAMNLKPVLVNRQ